MPNNQILIVDDDAAPREALELVFKDRYEVTTATSGTQAIDLLQKKPFAVAIIDVCMKGMSGLETLKKLRQLNPNIQTIILTGFKTRKTVLEALGLGASNCLFKPFEIGLLETTVKQGRDRFDFLSSQDPQANQMAHKRRDDFLLHLKKTLETTSDFSNQDTCEGHDALECRCMEICRHHGHRLLESVNDILEYSQFLAEKNYTTYHSFEPRTLAHECLSTLDDPEGALSVGDSVPSRVAGPAYELQMLLNKMVKCTQSTLGDASLRLHLEAQLLKAPRWELCFRLTSPQATSETPHEATLDNGQHFDLGLHFCKRICEKIDARFIMEDPGRLKLFAKVEQNA